MPGDLLLGFVTERKEEKQGKERREESDTQSQGRVEGRETSRDRDSHTVVITYSTFRLHFNIVHSILHTPSTRLIFYTHPRQQLTNGNTGPHRIGKGGERHRWTTDTHRGKTHIIHPLFRHGPDTDNTLTIRPLLKKLCLVHEGSYHHRLN